MSLFSLKACVHTPLLKPSSLRIHRVKAMKVKIQTRKIIKPSVSTPPNLREYKLSFIDEYAPNMHVPLVLFYPNKTDYKSRSFAQLEESLEKTLALLYPLSGRYIEDMRLVECNDQGAEFIRARADISLQELFDLNVDPNEINKFLPYKRVTGQVTEPIPLLATQVTMFQCGGLALGVSISHKIGDASTLITFLKYWATFSRRDTNVEVQTTSMSFNSSSLFPPLDLSPVTKSDKPINNDDCVTKKLSFSESAILNMEAKATQNGNIHSRMTKVQLVSALIWKAFIGVDRAIYGYSKQSVLAQPINLRRKSSSEIPVNAFGNLWGEIVTTSDTANMMNEYEDLTNLLANQVKKTMRDYSKAGHDKRKEMVLDSFSELTNLPDNTSLTYLTSWCNFPYYNVDFGFGKPVWLSFGCVPYKRVIALLDDEGGNGVQAYVGMGEKDVPYFEQEEDINRFSV